MKNSKNETLRKFPQRKRTKKKEVDFKKIDKRPSRKWPEVTSENGSLFIRPRKPHEIMRIEKFEYLCSL